MLTEIQKQNLIKECSFSSSRSSGPGGQNVNKVNTRIELRFNIDKTNTLTDEQAVLLKIKLNNRINNENELIIFSQSTRSQLKNKQLAIDLFLHLVENAFRKPKRRIATKPSKAAKRKRLENKRILSEKKSRRNKNWS